MVINFDILKPLLKSVESSLDIECFYLIYNENEELEKYDILKINKFLENVKSTFGVIILEGIGGDCKIGQKLACDFRKKFSSGYFVAVPNFIRSALVFSIFPSSGIFIDDQGYVGPVEPLIKNPHSGRFESTLSLMKSDDKKISSKAKQYWQHNVGITIDLCSQSNVHKLNKMDVNQLHNFLKLFLLSDHRFKIDKTNLEYMGFYCYSFKDEETWKNIKLFTTSVKSSLIEHKRKVRYLLGDSNSFKYF
jgi:hypothetical protein